MATDDREVDLPTFEEQSIGVSQHSQEDEMNGNKTQTMLMDKLRSRHTAQHRSWTDCVMKSIRSSFDRRGQTNVEHSLMRGCLDTLRGAMKVVTQESLVERLQLVSRKQGLDCQIKPVDSLCSVTLNADMFSIEIIVTKCGGVKDVKLAHHGDNSGTCVELLDLLRIAFSCGDFDDFTSHLEGLQSIYRVAGERDLKSKAFQALHSLESDLSGLAQFQNSISGVSNYIHKSPLGILVPRTAAITEHVLGRSVTVCLERSPAVKIQTMPLMSYTKQPSGNCLPSFNALTLSNSSVLPVCFALILPQPIPVAISIIKQIHSITDINPALDMGQQHLLSLILDSNSDGKIQMGDQLFVTLPNQHHKYINNVTGSSSSMSSVMLCRIPFCHPTSVPKILVLLRQQLLFNTMLASCVRLPASKDPTNCLMFEITVLSLTNLVVIFEHPAFDTMVTVDIDMSDITSLKCSLSGSCADLCTDHFAARVLQRSLSLPILLRALVRKGCAHLEQLSLEAKKAEEQAKRDMESSLLVAQIRHRHTHSTPTKSRPPPLPPPPLHSTPVYPLPTSNHIPASPIQSNSPAATPRIMSGGVDLLVSSPPGYPAGTASACISDSHDKVTNPLLVTLLDESGHQRNGCLLQQRQVAHQSLVSQTNKVGSQTLVMTQESPMLSKLLEDHISVATGPTHPPSVASPLGHGGRVVGQISACKSKSSKGRKRRSQSETVTGRSPKHHFCETDGSDRLGSFNYNLSSSPYEAHLGVSAGQSVHHQQLGYGHPPHWPPSQNNMPNVIDLTEESLQESSLKRLEYFAKEGKAESFTQENELQSFLIRGRPGNDGPSDIRTNHETGSKNEHASISPEGFLIGSGEMEMASLPDPVPIHDGAMLVGHTTLASGLSVTTAETFYATKCGHGSDPAVSQQDHFSRNPTYHLDPQAHAHQQQGMFFCQGQFVNQQHAEAGYISQHQHLNPISHHPTSRGGPGVCAVTVAAVGTTFSPKVVSSSSMTEMLDIDARPGVVSEAVSQLGPLRSSMTKERGLNKRSLFEKFERMDNVASSCSTSVTCSAMITSADDGRAVRQAAPKVRLRLHSLRTTAKGQAVAQPALRPPSNACGKPIAGNTFDFHSDEDDGRAEVGSYVRQERSTAVSSPNTTVVHLPGKWRPASMFSDVKLTSVGKLVPQKGKEKIFGSTKHKKGKDGMKREHKRKRCAVGSVCAPCDSQPVYRASTIDSGQRNGTKLKIRVSKEHIRSSSSVKSKQRIEVDVKACSSDKHNVSMKKSCATGSILTEKQVHQKQDIKKHQSVVFDRPKESNAIITIPANVLSSGKVSNKCMGSGKPNTANSAIFTGRPDPKLSKATIRLKPLNISSTSVSHAFPARTAVCGRNAYPVKRSVASSMSISSIGKLSLSTILPNAPTASSVASLPKIPKVSSVANSVNVTCISSTTVPSPATCMFNNIEGCNSDFLLSNGLTGLSDVSKVDISKAPVCREATGRSNLSKKSSNSTPGHKFYGLVCLSSGVAKSSGIDNQNKHCLPETQLTQRGQGYKPCFQNRSGTYDSSMGVSRSNGIGCAVIKNAGTHLSDCKLSMSLCSKSKMSVSSSGDCGQNLDLFHSLGLLNDQKIFGTSHRPKSSSFSEQSIATKKGNCFAKISVTTTTDSHSAQSHTFRVRSPITSNKQPTASTATTVTSVFDDFMHCTDSSGLMSTRGSLVSTKHKPGVHATNRSSTFSENSCLGDSESGTNSVCTASVSVSKQVQASKSSRLLPPHPETLVSNQKPVGRQSPTASRQDSALCQAPDVHVHSSSWTDFNQRPRSTLSVHVPLMLLSSKKPDSGPSQRPASTPADKHLHTAIDAKFVANLPDRSLMQPVRPSSAGPRRQSRCLPSRVKSCRTPVSSKSLRPVSRESKTSLLNNFMLASNTSSVVRSVQQESSLNVHDSVSSIALASTMCSSSYSALISSSRVSSDYDTLAACQNQLSSVTTTDQDGQSSICDLISTSEIECSHSDERYTSTLEGTCGQRSFKQTLNASDTKPLLASPSHSSDTKPLLASPSHSSDTKPLLASPSHSSDTKPLLASPSHSSDTKPLLASPSHSSDTKPLLASPSHSSDPPLPHCSTEHNPVNYPVAAVSCHSADIAPTEQMTDLPMPADALKSLTCKSFFQSSNSDVITISLNSVDSFSSSRKRVHILDRSTPLEVSMGNAYSDAGTTVVGEAPVLTSVMAMSSACQDLGITSKSSANPATDSNISVCSSLSTVCVVKSATIFSSICSTLASAPLVSVAPSNTATPTLWKLNGASVARSRKGSLSAIVDKLATRIGVSSGLVSDCVRLGLSSFGGKGGSQQGKLANDRQCVAKEGLTAEIASTSAPPPSSVDDDVINLSCSSSPITSVFLSGMTDISSSHLKISLSPRRLSDNESDIGLDLRVTKSQANDFLSHSEHGRQPPSEDGCFARAEASLLPVDGSGAAVEVDMKCVEGALMPGVNDSKIGFNDHSAIQSRSATEQRWKDGQVPAAAAASLQSLEQYAFSPSSSSSSPENELVIDCDEYLHRSAAVMTKAERSECVFSADDHKKPVFGKLLAKDCQSILYATLRSECPLLTKVSRNSPSRSQQVMFSPSRSPHIHGEVDQISPCEIDDDLMDAALGF